jgi:hypothetical protein
MRLTAHSSQVARRKPAAAPGSETSLAGNADVSPCCAAALRRRAWHQGPKDTGGTDVNATLDTSGWVGVTLPLTQCLHRKAASDEVSGGGLYVFDHIR